MDAESPFQYTIIDTIAPTPPPSLRGSRFQRGKRGGLFHSTPKPAG